MILFLAALFAIWGVYSYRTDKLSKYYRYSQSFIRQNPITSLLVIILLFAIILLLNNSLKSFNIKAKRVEKYADIEHKKGIDVKTLNSTSGLIIVHDLINKPTVLGSDSLIIADLISRYNHIYENLPENIKKQEYINNNNLNLHLPSTFLLLKIKDVNQSLYFIIHHSRKQDKNIEIFELDHIPNAMSLKNYTGNIIPENKLKECIENLQKWHKGEIEIHGDKGYGQAGGTAEDIKLWIYGYLPYSLNGFDYRGMLIDVFQLDSLKAP